VRKSTVYFFVVLTLLSLGLILVPRAFSQTQDIKIVSYSYYTDSLGYLDVVGEVQNVGPNTVNPVVLTGAIYSPDGTEISNSYCPVWVSYLTPQQKAPFYMEFPPPSSIGIWQPQDIAKVALTVSIANATSSYQYPDLKVTSNSGSIGTTGNYSGVYTVNGVIQNYGSQTATDITVDATFYNATGTVVAVGNTYDILGTYLTSSLAPSSTISFQVPAFDLNQSVIPSSEKIHSYSLLIQATGPILQGTPPITTTPPSTESSTSPSITSFPSNSSSPTDVTLIVIVVVIIAVAAVAGTILLSRTHKPHQTVKETKKARKKSVAKILPLAQAFFSKQSTLSLRNMSLFKYFLRTLVVYGL
jgi:hypothetical protein